MWSTYTLERAILNRSAPNYGDTLSRGAHGEKKKERDSEGFQESLASRVDGLPPMAILLATPEQDPGKG